MGDAINLNIQETTRNCWVESKPGGARNKLVHIEEAWGDKDEKCRKEGRGFWYFAGCTEEKISNRGILSGSEFTIYNRMYSKCESCGIYLNKDNLERDILFGNNIECWKNFGQVDKWIHEGWFIDKIEEQVKVDLKFWNSFDMGIDKIYWYLNVVRAEEKGMDGKGGGKVKFMSWNVVSGDCILV